MPKWDPSKRALSASIANKLNIPCKHGHTGCWQESKLQKDGYIHKRCRKCSSIYNKAWVRLNPGILAEWRKLNIVKCRLKSRKFRNSTPDRRLQAIERCKTWKKNNPERVKLHRRIASARRRAQKTKTKIETISLDEVLLHADGVCKICCLAFDTSPIEFDHIIPLSRGGTHTRDNLQAVHAVCNHKKGTKLLSELDVIICQDN